jgi:hypothetical protein
MKSILIAAFVFFAFAVNGQESAYKPAYYYDKKGSRIEGFVDTSFVISEYVKFKNTLASEEIKLRAYSVQALIIEPDSFFVVRNFRVEGDYSNMMRTVTAGFAKVIETGPVNLYQAFYLSNASGGYSSFGSTTGGGIRRSNFTYLLSMDPKKTPLSVEMGIDDFVKQMTKYFQDSPEICDRIRKKEFSYPKIQLLVKEYNKWHTANATH